MSNEITARLKIYAVGGAGINLAKTFEVDRGREIPASATPDLTYVDTSRANLQGLEDNDNVFLIDGKDGSGKIRGLNAADIVPIIPPLLNKYKPGDMNVVVFSASGGSGSVGGPLIAGELLSRGLPVVCLVVGSSESAKATENTIRSIKTLEAQVDKARAPLVMAYEHNDDRKRSEVDHVFRHLISSLGVLASRQNAEMDSTDILHVLRFDRATSVTPRLATISVHRSNETLDPDAQYISMASLYADPDAPTTDIRPEYHAAGYLPHNKIEGAQVFHFPVRLDEVKGILAHLEKVERGYKDDTQTRVLAQRALDDNDVVTDSGLVL